MDARGLAHAGAIVAMDRGGKVVIHRALVRPEDRKAAAKADCVSRHAGAPGASVQAAPKAAESEALTRRLTAHRTVALQRVLADNTQVALAAPAHNLLQRLTLDDVHVVSGLDVQGKGCEGQLDGATEPGMRAWCSLRGACPEEVAGPRPRLRRTVSRVADAWQAAENH